MSMSYGLARNNQGDPLVDWTSMETRRDRLFL